MGSRWAHRKIFLSGLSATAIAATSVGSVSVLLMPEMAYAEAGKKETRGRGAERHGGQRGAIARELGSLNAICANENAKTTAPVRAAIRFVPHRLRRFSGEPCRIRTCDPLIKSQLLYQLS